MGYAWGEGLVIETKAPGKKPTPRQEETIRHIVASDTKVFVIDGDTTELETWLLLHAGNNS
jgi:hypothetical protein